MMDVPDSVPPDPGSPADELLKLKASVRNANDNMGVFRESMRLQSRMLRFTYECLLEQNFTSEQALEIIKTRGTSLMS